jgi:FixJ family two-component response regulator
MTQEVAPAVFVVDDDDLVRASIQGMLKSVGSRSESFGTAQEFLRSKRPDAPSCLVLDIRLPGVNGLDFQHQLVDAGIRIPVIFITGHGDIPMTVKAMKFRCRGVSYQAIPRPRPARCDQPCSRR